MKKIKEILEKVQFNIQLVMPFLLMDIVIRVLALEVGYSRKRAILPSILFSLIWILFFVLTSTNFKQKIGRVVYSIWFLLFFVVFLVNCIYFPYTDFFFSFHLLLLASEGSSYILDTILGTNPIIFVVALVVLIVGILTIKKFPEREKGSWKGLLLVIGVFTIVRMLIPNLYGKANGELEWDTWRNPRNVYENFNDANKSMKICGLYEYAMRDAYITFLQPKEKENPSCHTRIRKNGI